MTTTLERARPATPPEPSRPPAEALGPRQRRLVLAAMCLALVLVIAGPAILVYTAAICGQPIDADATAARLTELLFAPGPPPGGAAAGPKPRRPRR